MVLFVFSWSHPHYDNDITSLIQNLKADIQYLFIRNKPAQFVCKYFPLNYKLKYDQHTLDDEWLINIQKTHIAFCYLVSDFQKFASVTLPKNEKITDTLTMTHISTLVKWLRWTTTSYQPNTNMIKAGAELCQAHTKLG